MLPCGLRSLLCDSGMRTPPGEDRLHPWTSPTPGRHAARVPPSPRLGRPVTAHAPAPVPSHPPLRPAPRWARAPQRPLCPQVSVNGKRLDLTYSFLGSRGVGQCYTSSPCERQPCQNGATCMPAGEYEFQCLCLDGFKGGRAQPARRGAWGGGQPLRPTPAHCALAHRRPL